MQGIRIYFAVLGYTLMFFFLVAVWRRARIAVKGIDAAGTVVGPYSHAIDGFVYSASRVEYLTAAGRRVSLIHYPGVGGPLPTGSQVTVRYLPDQQNMHFVKTPAGCALAPITLLGLAGVSLFAAYR